MREQLTRGVIWLAFTKVAVNVLAFVSTILLARLLLPEDFGLVALATAIMTILLSTSELSLASALVHHPAPTEVHFQTSWTLNVLRAAIVALVICLTGPVVAHVYHEPRLVAIMLAIGAGVALSGFSNPKVILFTRNLVFWQEFALSVSQKIAGVVVCVTVAYCFNSYWALVAGYIASHIMAVSMSYLIIPFKPRFNTKHAAELFSFSSWLILGQLINTLNWRLDPLLISGVLGSKSLGYYTVGDNLAGLATREVIGPLEATLFPAFSRLDQNVTRLKQAYRAAQALISTIALPVGIGVAFTAHMLVLLIMGPKWLPIVPVFQILACIYAFQTLTAPAHPLAMALGRTKLLFKRDLLSFCLRLPIIIIGLYSGGLMGVVYARIATNVIGITINLLLVKRLVGIDVWQQLTDNKRSMFSVAIMALVLTLSATSVAADSSSLQLLYGITRTVAIGVVSYSGMRYLLWRMANKPTGPETELLRMLSRLSAKLHPVHARG